MTNIEIIQSVYKHFSEGNNHISKTYFHPQIEWTVSQGLPFINDKTTFIGEDDIEENIFSALPRYIDNYRIEPEELFGAENKVVMTGYYVGTNRASGNTFKASVTHIWTIEHGKLTKFFQTLDTAELLK